VKDNQLIALGLVVIVVSVGGWLGIQRSFSEQIYVIGEIRSIGNDGLNPNARNAVISYTLDGQPFDLTITSTRKVDKRTPQEWPVCLKIFLPAFQTPSILPKKNPLAVRIVEERLCGLSQQRIDMIIDEKQRKAEEDKQPSGQGRVPVQPNPGLSVASKSET